MWDMRIDNNMLRTNFMTIITTARSKLRNMHTKKYFFNKGLIIISMCFGAERSWLGMPKGCLSTEQLHKRMNFTCGTFGCLSIFNFRICEVCSISKYFMISWGITIGI